MGEIQEINRKLKPRIVPQLNRREKIITSPDEITDTFANILRDPPIRNKKPGENKFVKLLIAIHL